MNFKHSIKQFIALIAVVAFCTSYTHVYKATCTGAKNCSACKNCKYCKHCAKDGGTCGVCKKRLNAITDIAKSLVYTQSYL